MHQNPKVWQKTSTSARVNWESPSNKDHFSTVTYDVNCESSAGYGNPVHFEKLHEAKVDIYNLIPYMEYDCHIYANYLLGPGGKGESCMNVTFKTCDKWTFRTEKGGNILFKLSY